MAFSKKIRPGSTVKFNRLLTPHLKVAVCGKTAVEIAPSKGSPHEGEQYVFNFTAEDETTKFLDILNDLRSQLWNHDELRLTAAKSDAGEDAAGGADDGTEPVVTMVTEASTSNSATPEKPSRENIGNAATETTFRAADAAGSSSTAEPATSAECLSLNIEMNNQDRKDKTPAKRLKVSRMGSGMSRAAYAAAAASARHCDSLFRQLKMDGPSAIALANRCLAATKHSNYSDMPNIMEIPVVCFSICNANLFVQTRTGELIE